MNGRFVRVHASCVRLGKAGAAFRAPATAGILILGASGAGKSDLALRLVAAGATLVADDLTELFLKRNALHARAPRPIASLIEIRGVGIVDVPYTDEVRVMLAAKLEASVPRLPRLGTYAPPAQLRLPQAARPPLLAFVAHEPSAPAKIAATAAALARGGFHENVKRQ